MQLISEFRPQIVSQAALAMMTVFFAFTLGDVQGFVYSEDNAVSYTHLTLPTTSP